MYRARDVENYQEYLVDKMKDAQNEIVQVKNEINDLKKQISKLETDYKHDGRDLIERKEIFKRTIEAAKNRKSKLLLKLDEAAKFLQYLNEEPQLILQEIQNIRKVIDKIIMLREYTNRVKNGDVNRDTLYTLNTLQNEVNTYAETNIDVLKSKITKLNDSYNAKKSFAVNYTKYNTLNNSDYNEIRAIVELSNENIEDPEYVRLEKSQEDKSEALIILKKLLVKKSNEMIRLKDELGYLKQQYNGWDERRKKYKESEKDKAYSNFQVF